MYKLENDIPIPLKIGARSELTKLFQNMAVGQSFLFPHNRGLFSYAKSAKVKISTRREGDQFRVWRVA